MATLLAAARANALRGLPDCALFEAGPAFVPGGQQVMLAAVRTGHTPRSWAAASQPVDPLAAKADALAVLAALGVPAESLTVTTDVPAWYHPGRSGVVRQGPKLVLAQFGALHPRVLAGLDLAVPAVAMELFLDRIPHPKRRKKTGPELPAFQPVHRDFAFLVEAGVTADAVLRAARGAERALITSATLFDVYDKLPAGQRSLGIEVVLQPRTATLTDAEIEAACAKVVAAVAKATGATLRG